ncbi:hypothetical protein Tco_0679605 [Tanacetum coccineum]|uniref:EF-hand domain-containing protein n=1 Tax=Tanacetum coccineum TaxID=301880 RepID=A0ABQ4XJK8_9ASTR
MFLSRLESVPSNSFTSDIVFQLQNQTSILNLAIPDKQARKCSGGIKRRLHVVVSLIIDPKTFGNANADGDGKICIEEWKEFALRYPRLLKNTNVPDVDNIAMGFRAQKIYAWLKESKRVGASFEPYSSTASSRHVTGTQNWLTVDFEASYMSSFQISLLQVHRVGVYEIFAPGHVLTEVARQHLDLKVVEYWGEKGVDYWNVVEWKKEKYENHVQEIVESGVAGVYILRQTYVCTLTVKPDQKGPFEISY